MKKKKLNYLTVISGIILAALICLVVYIAFAYYDLMSLQKQYNPEPSTASYNYHCAFITDNYDDAFWDSAYEGAREQGAESGIFVEKFGSGLYPAYSTDDLLKMATAARVDAIILEATGEESTTSLIREAAENGIAVSTIYKDDMDSERFSFTGINNFHLGYEYGELALKHAPKDSDSIMVLLDGRESNAEQRLLVSGIGRVLEEREKDITLETMILDSSDAFNVEDQVREFLKNSHGETDIIICTDLAQTQSVSQNVIDLNYVGDFTIIGFYQSDSVLEALKNGVIAANIVIDTEQMGKDAVSSLAEYLADGHTSDYISVNISKIERQEAAARLAEMEAAQSGGAEYE